MTVYAKDGIYVNGKKVSGWPAWEKTCPGCGRFHRQYIDVSGDGWRCVLCGWEGDRWERTA